MRIVSRIRPLPAWIHRAPPGSRLAAAASAIGIAWACSTGGAPDEDDPLRLEIAASIADNVVGPTFADFDEAASTLVEATAAWANATAAGSAGDAERDAAREAWSAAMLVWQRAEVMQLGPAGSSAFHVGGEDLRDEIYSWPTVSTCRVDEELVAEGYGVAGFFADSLVNVRGLYAIEYLLFADGPDNTCAATDPINQDGSWAALAAEEVVRRRSAYAAAAAVQVDALAQRLAQAWAPGTGEFALGFASAGESGSPYENPAAVLDEIVAAMLYTDTMLKDRKLGATTADALESGWSRRSKEHAVANLEGLRLLLLGGSSPEAGTGFDDFLRERGEDELAADLLAAVDVAIASAGAVGGTYSDAVTADSAALVPAHDATAVVTTLLKGDLVVALELTPPGEGAGDLD